MRPPAGTAPAPTAITGTRNTKAETKRTLSVRVINAMKAADMEPHGWQVRSLVATLIANREEPSDEQVLHALMAAPWYPKPRIRRHGVGDPGWRTRS